MTQTALGQKSGLPQTLISRIENSVVSELGAEQLLQLAAALGFPISWFSPSGDNLYNHPLSLHSAAFRKAASPSQKKIDFVIALTNHYVLQIRKLLDAVSLETTLELPSFEIVEENSASMAQHAAAVTSAEEAANRVRQIWRLKSGPIENLTALVEASGVVVIHADFEDVDVDGVTIRKPDMRPIIFLNQKRPACRQRFSLAHELGHVVLHGYNTPNMELEANRFAAELLMPRADIFGELSRKLSISRLGKLKQKWRASMASLVYRSGEISVQSSYAVRQLWIEISKAGYRVREPVEFDIDREKPSVFQSLIDIHFDQLDYSCSELAALVDTNVDEFRKMAGLNPEPTITPKVAKLKVVVDNSSGVNQNYN